MSSNLFCRIQEQAPIRLPVMVKRMIGHGLTMDNGEAKTKGWFCAVLLTTVEGRRRPIRTTYKFPLGDATPEMRSYRFSEEKCRRILLRQLTSSFKLRNGAKNRWGGGILITPTLAIAASGFPEDADETLALHFAVKIGAIDQHGVLAILAVSKNERYERFPAAA